MRILRQLLKLSPRELLMLCQASALLILAEVSLRIWSLRIILRALHRRFLRAQTTLRTTPAPETLTGLMRLVEVADRHGVFRPSCLRRALVLAWLFNGQGIATTLRIGVAQSDDQLRAHAWLEVQGATRMRFFAEPDYTGLSPSPAYLSQP